MIHFQLKTEVLIGNGQFRKLPDWLRQQGVNQPGFLIDEGFAKTALCQEVLRSISPICRQPPFVQTARGTAEPTYDYLDELAAIFRKQTFDLLIGVGGGSCMDSAKAIAALQTNPGGALGYRGFDKLTVAPVPTLLVPTTAGTGSEVTVNASFVDAQSKRKMGINGRHMSATYAWLDGETTLSCPYRAAVGSAADAIVHSLESFCCKQHNRVTRLFSTEAFRLVAGAMRCLKDEPGNLEKRLDLLLGAYFAGAALFNSGSGIAGALSYPLGTHYGVPHGMGGAIFCLGVVRYNIDRGYYDYSELWPAIAMNDSAQSPEDRALEVLNYLQQLFDHLGVPKNLSAFNIGPERYEHLVDICSELQGAFDQNPVPFSAGSDLPLFLKGCF